MNLIKCKFHQVFSMVILTCLKLVWRLSEFAFLCVYFGRRTFCIYGRKIYEKENLIDFNNNSCIIHVYIYAYSM